MMNIKQTTILSDFSVSGVGLHTGSPATITICPAKANTGYIFMRTDLEGSPTVHADVLKVIKTNRGTKIEENGATVSTVEHVLSALRGLNVDNALLKIDGPEVPIMDGSAKSFVEGIMRTGIVDLEEDREYLEIWEQIEFIDEETGSEYLILPSDHLDITVMIDFNSQVLGQQYAHLHHLSEYAEKIAPSRTFVFLHELENLLDQNLIKGGDLDNAVVIVDRVMAPEELHALAQKLGKPSIEVIEEGVLNTTDLRFKNEPARHKLLDVIGDLSLMGRPIRGRIVASKPGHTSNVRFAQKLKRLLKEQQKLKGKPRYDADVEPIKDVNAIQAMLPHRYPFLMVDKIIELSDRHVVGVKNVTHNEFFFPGHFPNNPIFPGVLQIEALAQTGGILALSTVEDPENWDTYFLKINDAKFKRKVIPGDTLILKMELLSPVRRGLCHMYGTAYVGNNIVSEGELIAQIVRRPVHDDSSDDVGV